MKKSVFTEEQISIIASIAAQAATEAVKAALAQMESPKAATTQKPQSKKTSSSDWEAKKQELKALSESFAFTKKMDNFIKSNPSCSKKEFDAKFGCKGMTRDMLSARKKELGVR